MIGTALFRELVFKVRRFRARLRGIDVSTGCLIGSNVRLRRLHVRGTSGSLILADGCDLRDAVILETWGGHIRIGRNVFIGPYTVVYGHGGVEIGNDTLVSMHCRILSSKHTIPPAGVPIRSQPDVLLPTRIGQDVWLGAGVTVVGGVTIGDGCVVGAGAVLTHDLPPFSIAMGVPARIVGTRPAPLAPARKP